MKTLILTVLASIALGGCALLKPDPQWQYQPGPGKTAAELHADYNLCDMEAMRLPIRYTTQGNVSPWPRIQYVERCMYSKTHKLVDLNETE